MKKYGIELKWAIIFVVMSLLWMVMERLVGLHDQHIDKHMIYTNFIAIPSIVVYVLALLNKRKTYYEGKMTYLQGFVTGLIITFIVTILSPASQWVTSTIITPDYFTNVIEYSVASGYYATREEAEAFFNMKNYITMGLWYTPMMGVVTTAIVAIFTRKS